MDIIERRESAVRSYVRAFPATFAKAQGALLYDTSGKRYIDFFSGAGGLNYGHNNPQIKAAIMEYLAADGVTHSLDMATAAKVRFLERFEQVILQPRQLDYKVQFTGPTGTNAVEAALKIARKVKQRANVVAFTNGYHGLTGSALALTGNAHYRNPFYTSRANVTMMPFDGYFGSEVNTIDYFRKFLTDSGSGLDRPAAVILETIQAEGGINVARPAWLQALAALCQEFDMLLIVDDIQVGNGRTGRFFSFEGLGFTPDIVTVSKSISGYGLPMALVLLKPELDQWLPGEHTGTFRGNNLAFVGATEALRYWETDELTHAIQRRSRLLDQRLHTMQTSYPQLEAQVRGKGLIYGLAVGDPELAGAIGRESFTQGLILERCGAEDNVLKFLPPLVIEDELLAEGLSILNRSIATIVG
ncbi:MAG: diaminobutyrate--2-oxoglutarate transaminase [Caldilineaceae bacterium]